MRKHAPSIPLVGQLLFAEERDATITLDCLLTRQGSGAAAVPVTREARVTGRAHRTACMEPLPLLQGPVAAALNVGKVDEDIVSLVTGDEPVTLLRIEKLHCSRSQRLALLPYSNERLLVTAQQKV